VFLLQLHRIMNDDIDPQSLFQPKISSKDRKACISHLRKLDVSSLNSRIQSIRQPQTTPYFQRRLDVERIFLHAADQQRKRSDGGDRSIRKMYLYKAIRYGYFAMWPKLALMLKEDGNYQESFRCFHRGLYSSDRNGFASTCRMISRLLIKDKFFVRYYTDDAWIYFTYYGLPSKKETLSSIEDAIPFLHCLKDVFMRMSPVAISPSSQLCDEGKAVEIHQYFGGKTNTPDTVSFYLSCRRYEQALDAANQAVSHVEQNPSCTNDERLSAWYTKAIVLQHNGMSDRSKEIFQWLIFEQYHWPSILEGMDHKFWESTSITYATRLAQIVRDVMEGDGYRKKLWTTEGFTLVQGKLKVTHVVREIALTFISQFKRVKVNKKAAETLSMCLLDSPNSYVFLRHVFRGKFIFSNRCARKYVRFLFHKKAEENHTEKNGEEDEEEKPSCAICFGPLTQKAVICSRSGHMLCAPCFTEYTVQPFPLWLRNTRLKCPQCTRVETFFVLDIQKCLEEEEEDEEK
jgi:tetratricopeptide (TPR) repeat protein